MSLSKGDLLFSPELGKSQYNSDEWSLLSDYTPKKLIGKLTGNYTNKKINFTKRYFIRTFFFRNSSLLMLYLAICICNIIINTKFITFNDDHIGPIFHVAHLIAVVNINFRIHVCSRCVKVVSFAHNN